LSACGTHVHHYASEIPRHDINVPLPRLDDVLRLAEINGRCHHNPSGCHDSLFVDKRSMIDALLTASAIPSAIC